MRIVHFFAAFQPVYFELNFFGVFQNLQVYVRNNQLYKEQVQYFFQLYSKQYYKVVNMSLPLTIFQEHLNLGQH